ncbi:MAG: hypothetical protein IJK95_05870 [Firmicutes bacterium]|nr:hypothetical protein [Bacillota bacterium]
MKLSENNLIRRAEYLEEIIAQKKEATVNAPEGRLRVSSSHGKTQYMLREQKSKEKYITIKDIELAKKIAQRQYDEKVLRAAEAELDSLNKLLLRYKKGSAEDIFDNLSNGRKKIVKPIFITDEEYVRQWLEHPYTGLGFDEGDPEIYNDNGLRVRSKSEAMISNRFNRREVPFRYEEPLYLKGFGTVYPDFRVLNVRYRKEYIHEHLGKMDDPAYVEDNIKKIKAYIKNGYTIGKNLLLTFETHACPLNINEIDDLIDKFLK